MSTSRPIRPGNVVRCGRQRRLARCATGFAGWAGWLGCWVIAAAVAGAVSGGGCAPSAAPTVIVVVSGISSDTQQLRYAATLNGSPLRQSDTVQPTVTQQIYPLADGSSGSFTVDIRAIGSDGCALASGQGQATLSGSSGQRLTLQVSLIPRSPALCPITVSTIGSGSVSSDPTGLSCGSQCVLDLPAGSSLSLTASPQPRNNFVGWSGGCSGSGPCGLRIFHPISVAATFQPQLCSGSGVCWESPLPGDLNLVGLWGSGPQDLWAVGDFGVLLHYDGHVWSVIDSPTTNSLRAIWGSSAKDVWAVGLGGTILHYDGGSWAVVATPGGSTVALYAIAGSAASDVWAVGATGTALHFDGSSWTAVATGLVADLYGLTVSPTQLLAVSNSGQLFRRASPQWGLAGSNGSALWGISGPSDSTILAGGDGGSVQSWDGSQLSKQPGYPSIASLRAIHLRTASDGWMVGSEGAVLHTNGSSLSRYPAPTNQTLQAVFAVADSDVWAVGTHGAIVHFDGNSVTAYGAASYPDSSDLRAVSGSGPSEQWAVGANNTILRNSGQGWVMVPSGQPAGSSFRGVYVASPSDVWVVGNLPNGYAVVLRWNGSSFSPATVPLTTQLLTAVSGSSPSNVWIGGSAGTILKWNGSSFALISSGSVAPQILSVAAVSPTEVWFGCAPVTVVVPVVRTTGCVLRWDGSSVSLIAVPQVVSLFGAAAAASGDIWFAGSNNLSRGIVLRVQGGMLTSFVDLSGSYGELDAIASRGGSDVWVSGSGGTILHSTDGAVFSRVVTGLPPSSLYGIIAASPSALVTVGSGRAILRILQ